MSEVKKNLSRSLVVHAALLATGILFLSPAQAQKAAKEGLADPARAGLPNNPIAPGPSAKKSVTTSAEKPPVAVALVTPGPKPAGPAGAAPPPAPMPRPAAPPLAPKPAAPPVPAKPAAGAAEELPLPGAKEFSECQRYPRDKKVLITLKPETELMELIGWIKTISCRPFILPSSIRQSKVTIVAPEMVTADEAYRIFLSALESMGLTVQPEGRVLKIIESNRARESSIPVYGPGEPVPRSEQYVTRLLRLRYITTDEVVQVLNRLKGRDGDIMPYATSNTLVITDLATNIRRMEEVVRALDVPLSGEKIWVIRLRNIVANEVAQMLEKVFSVQKTGTAGQPRRAPLSVSPTGESPAPPPQLGSGEDSISQILADERTNSLIVVSTERTYQRVLALVRRLEAQGEKQSGADRIHVYGLENANAEDMVQVLGGLGITVSSGTTGRRPSPGGRSPSSSAGSSGTGGGASSLFQDEVKVSPDKATNSLVILATSRDYLTLRDVIRRLDVPRRQVFIEATVMEVGISKNRDLGLSYHGGLPVLGGLVVGGLQGKDFKSLAPLSALSATGLVGGLIGPQFASGTIFGQSSGTAAANIPPQFGLLIQAVQNNNDFNILQAPNMLATDNEKASIEIGQNLPFPSAITGAGFGGMGTNAGGLGAFPLQSVQRQNVSLKLELTPHVNSADYVRLEIKSTIDDVLDKNYNGLGPATNKRALETTAVVRDQQPVVLGGIMRDSVRETVTKIPILGDIPILGYLFKTRSTDKQKQMLLIILTPYIINDPSDLARIFERKTRERREFMEAYSSFSDERDVVGPIDYSRRRGALEEINQTAQQAEREMVELRAAEHSLGQDGIESGPVELPAGPRPSAPLGAPPPSGPPPAPSPSLPAPPPGMSPPPPRPAPPGAPPG